MSVYMGIDWSTKKHDVVLLNAVGAIIARLTIPHQVDGFEELDSIRAHLGVPPATVWWAWKRRTTC